jgi:adenylosuccinate synthase
MPFSVIIGAQWGDEGKGRIVDLLAGKADIVARYYGGDNAGHTVAVGDELFKLHLLPSGIVHQNTVGLLGNGMVINPETLIREMQVTEEAGVVINPDRIRISHAAHLITPGHIALDHAQEKARGDAQIGTTKRGIGPAYTSKVTRSGIRFEDMLDGERFEEKLRAHLASANVQLEQLYGADPLDVELIVDQFAEYAAILCPYISDVGGYAAEALSDGKTILAEGAQGTLLDLDHGTYPFVTSSTPTAPGALVGLGLGLGLADRVLGVVKAFQTRVGEGPFPTELAGDLAVRLRGTGANQWDEFGTTTGRPRRVGWLDVVLLRYAVRVNGITEIALTKLDILSGFETIKICSEYRRGHERTSVLPYGPSRIAEFEAGYEEVPGWEQDLTGTRNWDDLPETARAYIKRIEELVDLPVTIISVGPERNQVIQR